LSSVESGCLDRSDKVGEKGQVAVAPKIRTATQEDSAALAELTAQLGYPTSREIIRKRLGFVLGLPDHAVFVAAGEDGRLVGWAHVFVAVRVESDLFAELGGLVVADSARRQGIGKALVAKSAEWGRKQGLTRLRVRCRSGRTDAHAFYRQLGFELTKEQHIYDKGLGS
jgi:GNAT superfamily N-acetyltransferase